jgi:hypothetical protein
MCNTVMNVLFTVDNLIVVVSFVFESVIWKVCHYFVTLWSLFALNYVFQFAARSCIIILFV